MIRRDREPTPWWLLASVAAGIAAGGLLFCGSVKLLAESVLGWMH